MTGTSPSLGTATAERESLTVTVGDRAVPAAAVLAGFAVVLAVLPFLVGSFYTRLLTEALIFAIFALGVDLLWGYTGIMTFGHAVFFGVGAYTMAKFLKAGIVAGALGTYAGVGVSVALTGVLGLVVAGVLFYRGIQGGYFTIITLALAIVAEQTATSWNSVTGGFNGLTGIPAAEVGVPFVVGVDLLGVPLYYVVALVVVAVYLTSRRIARSSFGSALIAINENETKARALGYDIEKHKTLVFAISSAMAGLSGALYAAYQGFVSPPVLGFLLSTEVLVWILIGGRGTLVGAIVGTVFLIVFESLASGVFQFSWTLLLGVVLVLIVLRYPEGLVGVASRVVSVSEREVSAE